ncbi:glycoside hydrolase domain-containing protein [Streptomyces sp. NPDC020917]|uniref:glycoside hydrolase domain-containing protein n=1 Tax=Streptomyces sp. NPDC020917 TaxID=3365102 RepID=UPI0037BA4B72
MESTPEHVRALSRRALLAAAAGGSAAVITGLGAGRAVASPSAAASLVASGVDYSWGRPRPGVTAGQGYRFACRYLSYDTTGKNLSASEAQALIAAGLDIVCVWETSASEALGGYAVGAQSARDAQSLAVSCGMPAGRPIYFAVDFDATPGQQAVLDAYFDGVASVLGRGRTGAYGGYYPIQRLFDDGKITWGWQTYAWSGGQWEPRAQLRQVQNGITVDGADCDRDEAWAADFGQWGTTTPMGRRTQVTSIGGQGGTQSQVAAIGLDGGVYHNIRATGGTWAGWKAMGGYAGAGAFDADAVSLATMPDGTGSSQIAATGTDGDIYHNIRAASGTWQGWKPMSGYGGASTFNAGALSLTGLTDGTTQIAATGKDGNIYHNIRATSGTWQGWKPMSGYGGASTFNAGALSLTGLTDGTTQIAATGKDGNIYHNTRATSGTWAGWQPVSGFAGASTFNAGALSVTGMTDGSTQVVATGLDGDIYHNIRYSGGTWQGWKPMSGYAGATQFNARALSITGMTDGSAQIVAVGLDNRVYHNIRYSGGTWQGWAPMAGYAGAASFQCA